MRVRAGSSGRVLLTALTDAVFSGLWVGSAGLPAGRRRLTRTGLIGGPLLLAAGLSRIDRRGSAPTVGGRPSFAAPPGTCGGGTTGGKADRMPAYPRAVLLRLSSAVLVGWVALPAVRRSLERRWLRELEQAGHPHPHLALGMLRGAVVFAGSLAGAVARPRAARSPV